MEKPYSALRVGTGFWMRREGLRGKKNRKHNNWVYRKTGEGK